MEQTETERLWTRPFVMALAAMTLIFIPYSLSSSIFAVYILHDLKGSTQLAGFANSIFAIACILSRVHTPKVEKLFGARNTIIATSLLYLLSYLLFLPTKSPVAILAIRFFSGVCYALASTSLTSTTVQQLPPSRKGEGIAYLNTVYMVGWAIGPLIGVNILQAWGNRGMFWFCGLAFLPFVPLLLLMRADRAEGAGIVARDDAAKSFDIQKYIDFGVLSISCASMIVGATYSGVVSFVAAYAHSLNLFAASAYYFLLLAISAIITRLSTGRVTRQVGEKTLVYTCFVIFAAGMLLLGLARSTFGMLTSGVLLGLSVGFLTPSLQAISIANVPQSRIGIVTSTYLTMGDIGSGLGAYLFGLLIPALGYGDSFLVFSPVMLILPALFVWNHFAQERRREQRLQSELRL